MFQSFENTADPSQGPARLLALRAKMAELGLDGFFVPRADAHQGEYVAPCDERLAWLTGFTGSAGFAIALRARAGVFIDGRYRNQVRDQVDLQVFEPVHWPEVTAATWLLDVLPEGGRIGYDAMLHSETEIRAMETALSERGIELVVCANLVDQIWDDRPEPPAPLVFAHPIEFSGKKDEEKLADLAAVMASKGASHCVITLPDSLSWLLNIRGKDVAHNPVVQGFLIVHAEDRLSLFADPAKFAALGPDPRIALRPTQEFLPALAALDGAVMVDPKSAPIAVLQTLQTAGLKIIRADDPCVLPKAIKNDVEIAGARQAHLIDGVALCEFLTWFEATAQAGITEIDLVSELESQRRATGDLRDISFDTIAGSGPNGAVIHYRVSQATNRKLRYGDLVVLDSGGQYQMGTTDITRTLAVGPVGTTEKEAFTRVLKGMITLSRARFPKGLKGRDLDALARFPLWLAGLDYDHGTGHGVGSFLSVHEGPQRLSRAGDVTLEPGMILSNEPGYYRDGAFGIRIENLIVVREAPPLKGSDARDMLCFETLTYVPIERDLIEADMLDRDERAWLNSYHETCAQKLAPSVSSAAKIWLKRKTAPL
ncbi:MAG: aminopeptidase P family protein [Maritimibacter sp.]